MPQHWMAGVRRHALDAWEAKWMNEEEEHPATGWYAGHLSDRAAYGVLAMLAGAALVVISAVLFMLE